VNQYMAEGTEKCWNQNDTSWKNIKSKTPEKKERTGVVGVSRSGRDGTVETWIVNGRGIRIV